MDEKKKRSPRYSVNAFARMLRISAPALWNVIQGKKEISNKRLLGFAPLLPVSIRARKHYRLLVKSAQCTDDTDAKTLAMRIEQNRKRERSFVVAQEKVRDLIAWDAFLVVESFNLSKGPLTKSELAKFTQLSSDDLDSTLGTLERLGVVKSERGSYRRIVGRVLGNAPSDQPDFKAIHQHGLRKAAYAVDAVPTTARYSATEMLCFTPELLSEAKQIINQAMDRIHHSAASTEKNRELYAMTFHLFPVKSP
jgi:uncharacterized protein (TIGR02147 family)